MQCVGNPRGQLMMLTWSWFGGELELISMRSLCRNALLPPTDSNSSMIIAYDHRFLSYSDFRRLMLRSKSAAEIPDK
eukprot:8294632-Karenia_brevis.AAC.1